MCSVKKLKIKLKLQDLKLHRFGYKRSKTLLQKGGITWSNATQGSLSILEDANKLYLVSMLYH